MSIRCPRTSGKEGTSTHLPSHPLVSCLCLPMAKTKSGAREPGCSAYRGQASLLTQSRTEKDQDPNSVRRGPPAASSPVRIHITRCRVPRWGRRALADPPPSLSSTGCRNGIPWEQHLLALLTSSGPFPTPLPSLPPLPPAALQVGWGGAPPL